MDVLINTRITKIPGPTVTIDCPACKAKSVNGESVRQVDQLELFYLLPFMKLRNTFVTCHECNKQLICTAPFDELGELSVDDLSQHLVHHVSIINKFLALASVLLCWVPFVGLLLGCISLAVNWRITGWTKKLSYIGIGASAVLTAAFMIILSLAGVK